MMQMVSGLHSNQVAGFHTVHHLDKDCVWPFHIYSSTSKPERRVWQKEAENEEPFSWLGYTTEKNGRSDTKHCNLHFKKINNPVEISLLKEQYKNIRERVSLSNDEKRIAFETESQH